MSTTVKRHPIRGLLGGLCAGIGATLLLIVYAKAPFGQATSWVPLLVLAVVGVLIGLFAPPRGGAGDEQVATPVPAPHSNVATTEQAPAPEAAAPEAEAPEAEAPPETPDDAGEETT